MTKAKRSKAHGLWLGWGDHPTISLPEDADEDSPPFDAELVCAVEWSQSPDHQASYSLHVAKPPDQAWSWVLVGRSFDDNWGKWHWDVAAATPRDDLDQVGAARYLATEWWKWSKREWAYPCFDAIDEDGVLDQDELWLIGGQIWPEQEE